jgi:hypothetical protein
MNKCKAYKKSDGKKCGLSCARTYCKRHKSASSRGTAKKAPKKKVARKKAPKKKAVKSRLLKKKTPKKKKKAAKRKKATGPSDAPECPGCENPCVVKSGRYGLFWACSAFPYCRGKCPQDGAKKLSSGSRSGSGWGGFAENKQAQQRRHRGLSGPGWELRSRYRRRKNPKSRRKKKLERRKAKAKARETDEQRAKAIADIRAAIKEMDRTYSGCDWCCGGGDARRAALVAELAELGTHSGGESRYYRRNPERVLQRAWKVASAAGDHETLASLRLAMESWDAVSVSLSETAIDRLENEYYEGGDFIILNRSRVVFYTVDAALAAADELDSGADEAVNMAHMNVLKDLTDAQVDFLERQVRQSISGATKKIRVAAHKVEAAL